MHVTAPKATLSMLINIKLSLLLFYFTFIKSGLFITGEISL